MSEPATLADLITAEVQRQTSDDAIKALVQKNVAQVVQRSIESALSFGDLNKQISKAVDESLKLHAPLDLPAYGAMVMAVLRAQMDAILEPLLRDRLAKEMAEILSVAPAEMKLSAIVDAMKADEEVAERWGTHATVIVEEIEEGRSCAGYKTVFLDPQSLEAKGYGRRDKYVAEARFQMDEKGKVFALTIDGKDAKTTFVMGALPTWKKMLFSAYGCGSTVIDDQDGYYDTSFGDY